MYTKIKAVLLIAFTSIYSNYVFAGTGNGSVGIAHVGQWNGIDIVFSLPRIMIACHHAIHIKRDVR